jgi:hypothetical protein
MKHWRLAALALLCPAIALAQSDSSRSRPASTLKLGVDGVLVEAGFFNDAVEAKRELTLRASPYLLWQPDRAWEVRLGARIDSQSQQGGAFDVDRTRAQLGDTYVRFRKGDSRFTAGAQTIVWGRVDETPLADRVSRVDLTRFALDDLAERRLPQWVLRWEYEAGDDKLDVVILPHQKGALLPARQSLWHPISPITGQFIGLEPNAAAGAIATRAPLSQDDGQAGGAAVRWTRTGGAVDFGLTLARTRQALPYFQLDGSKPSVTAVYPYNTFAGGDLEWTSSDLTWRMELGYTTGIPVTTTRGVTIDTKALEWVGGLEFFPGGKDTRVNLQLSARTISASVPTLELKEYYGAGGEVETTMAQGRWKLGMRFFAGLNVNETYLAPRVTFLGWEPHELYATVRLFDGQARSLAGFHRKHDMLAFGLKTVF